MATTLVTAPTEYPVTLSDVKTHLKIEANDFDGELSGLIDDATKFVEDMTGRALITQTWKFYLDDFKSLIKVPKPPLSSVTSITYTDSSGSSQTLASSNYTVDAKSQPGRIHQKPSGSFPGTYGDVNDVTITFVCGYGNKTAVPEGLKRAIYLYIERMFDNPSGPYGVALDNALEMAIARYKVDYLAL